MEPKEPLDVREEMAEMHDYIKERIQKSYRSKSYIEVCWLCYTCFENRISRGLEKIVSGCPKEDTANPRAGITAKIDCLKRLKKTNHPLLENADIAILTEIKGWCKRRNRLMHNLLTIEKYKELDKDFQKLAKDGQSLIEKSYELGAGIRNKYYEAESISPMSELVISKCTRRTKCINCNSDN